MFEKDIKMSLFRVAARKIDVPFDGVRHFTRSISYVHKHISF